jgi:hypothetical protein
MSADSTNDLRHQIRIPRDQPLAVTFRFPGALRHTLTDSRMRIQPANCEVQHRPALVRTVVNMNMPLTDPAGANGYQNSKLKAKRVS